MPKISTQKRAIYVFIYICKWVTHKHEPFTHVRTHHTYTYIYESLRNARFFSPPVETNPNPSIIQTLARDFNGNGRNPRISILFCSFLQLLHRLRSATPLPSPQNPQKGTSPQDLFLFFRLRPSFMIWISLESYSIWMSLILFHCSFVPFTRLFDVSSFRYDLMLLPHYYLKLAYLIDGDQWVLMQFMWNQWVLVQFQCEIIVLWKL